MMNHRTASFFSGVIACFLAAFIGSIDASIPSPSPTPALVPTTSSQRTSAAFYPQGRDRPHDYKILNEEVQYSGWRKVIRRRVSSPIRHPHTNDIITPLQQNVFDFDIIDQTHTTGGAVIIFAWNSTSKTATIIREYMPGPHRVLSGLAAGIVEDGKHSSMEGGGDEPDSLVAARYELEEECHLAGGAWYRLTEEGVSVPMDKYVVTEITPYLVIDPQHVPDPRPLDDEEDIEIVTRVSIEEIVRMIREGDFNLVGGWGALLALEKLRELGEIT